MEVSGFTTATDTVSKSASLIFPKAKKKKACYVCSLKDLCLPELEKTGNVETYMNNILAEDLEDNT